MNKKKEKRGTAPQTLQDNQPPIPRKTICRKQWHTVICFRYVQVAWFASSFRWWLFDDCSLKSVVIYCSLQRGWLFRYVSWNSLTPAGSVALGGVESLLVAAAAPVAVSVLSVFSVNTFRYMVSALPDTFSADWRRGGGIKKEQNRNKEISAHIQKWMLQRKQKKAE